MSIEIIQHCGHIYYRLFLSFTIYLNRRLCRFPVQADSPHSWAGSPLLAMLFHVTACVLMLCPFSRRPSFLTSTCLNISHTHTPAQPFYSLF